MKMKRLGLFLLIFVNLVFERTDSFAQNVCAKVSIEIVQEISFERQAFEARMKIQNNLPQDLTDLSVRITFLDAGRNPVTYAFFGQSSPPANAKFFYRADKPGMNLDADGATQIAQVPAAQTANLQWLIIPSPGASGNNPAGTMYFVGAVLSYKIGGKPQTVEIEPDYIFVKPMPSLSLDYFLPGLVYGDNPQTPLIKEPAVPFYLGLRVENIGAGSARKLTIQSGQPKIVANEQGLLADFYIQGSMVNGAASKPDLLVDLGDLAPLSRAVARWTMTSSLSGMFDNFTASISHADEFGGKLTSLILEENLHTHMLIKDIVVDLSGRDSVMDFLAWKGNIPRVFESDSGTADTDVAFHFPNAVLEALPSGQGRIGTGATAVAPGQFVFISAPVDTVRTPARVVRSDGKFLPLQNVWVSRKQLVSGTSVNWAYDFHLFDTNGRTDARAFSYTIDWAQSDGNRPPVILGMVNRYIKVGQPLSVTVRAFDPDGDTVSINFKRRPVGATFTDNAQGTATFSWVPGEGQIGTYPVTFTASDGVFNSEATLVISVTEGNQIDEWKKRFFEDPNSPSAANSADLDGDGMSNLLEYALGTDPTKSSVLQRPQVEREMINGKAYLVMVYQRRTDDASLVFETIASSSIRQPEANWEIKPELEGVSQTDVPDGMKRVRVRDSVSLEDAAAQGHPRYLRLRVRYEAHP